jgi:formylglycine-generating enzyme required for sulfatase activity
MPPVRKSMLLIAPLVASLALLAFTERTISRPLAAPRVAAPDLVELRPGALRYRPSGEFTRQGKPATAPFATVTINRGLAVMEHQVTAADYRRCVEAHACSMDNRDAAASDRPVVKVSWQDAHAYASWLSRETGTDFRLPTDGEWAYAAASRFNDDAMPESLDGSDPGQRALAVYDRNASREEAVDKAPRPIGSFGANENGLLDMAGNVWEWTDTCFVRSALNPQGEVATTVVNCGVRVVEGRHRTYMTNFIRNARAGGCAGGTPPSNLGFRLVHDRDRWGHVRSILQRLVGFGA